MPRLTPRPLPASALALVMTLGLASASLAQDETAEPMASLAPMASMEPMHAMQSLGPGLSIHDAWARESPMVALAGAAYLVIHNGSDVDDALVAATSPAAQVVELHQSSMDAEGMMSMTPVEQIPIPAGGTAVLEPGGYHLMLIDLLEPLVEGDEVEITLQFRSAEAQTISAPVASGPLMGEMDHTAMDSAMEHGDMDAEAMPGPSGEPEDAEEAAEDDD